MKGRGRLRLLAGLIAAACAPALAKAPDTALPLLKDWRADAKDAARRRVPIVILFSLPGCPYCEQVRQSHLAPMRRDPARRELAIIRQVDIQGGESVAGLAGERMTHADIARARGIRGAPVVQFWSPEGESIAEPLVGMLLPDFYGAYLDQALDAARARLAGKP